MFDFHEIIEIYTKNFIQNRIKAWEIITCKTGHVVFTFNITPVYIVSQLGYIILQWCIIKFYTYFILSKSKSYFEFFPSPSYFSLNRNSSISAIFLSLAKKDKIIQTDPVLLKNYAKKKKKQLAGYEF